MHRGHSTAQLIQHKKAICTFPEFETPVPNNIEGQQCIEIVEEEEANEAEVVLPNICSSELKHQLHTNKTGRTEAIEAVCMD